MQGRIIKGIAGFYYVQVVGSGVYSCKAKGIFRKLGIKPLVGDLVDLEVTHEADREGNITRIYDRKNVLVRPAVANIDQMLVIFAFAQPQPNTALLDRFLVSMAYRNIPAVICFNKEDLADSDQKKMLMDLYEGAGYSVIPTGALHGTGIDHLRAALQGKVSAVAGPSGVGKSSLINLLCPQAQMETAALSEKIDRGRHTTRHCELLRIDEETCIMDTPGFSSLFLSSDMEPADVGNCFPEFRPYLDACLYAGCSHIAEPQCGVKDALNAGKISPERYAHYREIYLEVKESRKY